MEIKKGFRYACYSGKYKEALDMVESMYDQFSYNNYIYDVLTLTCLHAKDDDVQIIQMITERGFDTRNITLHNRLFLELLQSQKLKIVEQLLKLTEAHTNYRQIFSAMFSIVTEHYKKMFRLLMYMFDCGAHPDWIRCKNWHDFLNLSDIYKNREIIRKSSIALIGAAHRRKAVMRIISRVLWSTRADERWYKLK